MRLFALLLAAAGASWSASNLPSAFEPNRGQAPDGEFVSSGRSFAVALRSDRISFTAARGRVTAVLVGASASSNGAAEHPLPGVSNYWRGQDRSGWVSNIPGYERVRYRGVYPGIDAVYYFDNDGRLEYDFVVAPGANPTRIALRFEGVRLHLEGQGDLVAQTPAGEFRQHRPVVYQERDGRRIAIDAHYVLRGNTARIALGRYDRTLPLIVDPPITWATFLGVSGTSESANAVTTDSSGNIYTLGTIVTSVGLNLLVSKLSPGGDTLISNVYLGGTFSAYTGSGSAYDVGYAIAVDSGGNIYLAGETASGDFPGDATYLTYSTSQYYPGYLGDAFITKINAAVTSIVYSHFFGGAGEDNVYAMAIDSNANVYVAGSSSSAAFPTTTGSAKTTNSGGFDAWVARFNSSGARVYCTFLGGAGNDYANAIALDSTGNAYVAGQTFSSAFPVTAGVAQSALSGTSDSFVAKIGQAAGTLLYSTLLGGSGDDFANAIAVDASGAAYVTGETTSTDFPIVGGVQKTFGGGAGDVFVTKVNPTGQVFTYSTYLGGTGEDGGNAIAVDAAGNAYVGGFTTSTDYPLQDAFQSKNSGTANATPNAIVAALAADGASLIFSSYLGGTSGNGTAGDIVNAVAVNCTTGLVAAGTTASSDFPATAGTLAAKYLGGSSNSFVAKVAAGLGVPAIAAGGVVNGATFSSDAVAPGSLISIFGSAIALNVQQAAATPLPVSLAGISVSVNGTPAPIVFASAGQLNVQLPYETVAGTATATVSGSCGPSPAVSFPVKQSAPYIFQNASGDGIVANQDLSINSAANPAAASSVVTVYLTGIGPLDNPVATGAAAPTTALSRATLPYSATIGGANAPVAFLGLTPAFVGLAQANITAPAGHSGKNAVIITVGGVPSNGPNIYLK